MVGLYGGTHPISTVLFPFKVITIEGSYVGTLEDLRELLALVQAGKVPPIPLATRPADQASATLSDLKSGGRSGGVWCYITNRWTIETASSEALSSESRINSSSGADCPRSVPLGQYKPNQFLRR